MNLQTKDIQDHFLAAGAGWRPLPLTGVTGLSGENPTPDVFINSYACCGVVEAGTTTQVQNSWKLWEQDLVSIHRKARQDAQDALARPNSDKSVPLEILPPAGEQSRESTHHRIPRDLFLVVLVKEIPVADASGLSQVANDTSSSRKILLSCEGRTIAKTLDDLAFFSARGSVGSTFDEPDEFQSQPQVRLDQAILEDLARRSATVIFGRLLEGKYPPATHRA